MLHSSVSEEDNGDGRGGAVVRGGVSLALEFSSGDGVSWSPSNWTLRSIEGNSQDKIQVCFCSVSLKKETMLIYSFYWFQLFSFQISAVD